MSKKDISSSQTFTKTSLKLDKKNNEKKATDASFFDSNTSLDYDGFLKIKESKFDEESLKPQNKLEKLTLSISDLYNDFKKLVFYEVILVMNDFAEFII